MTHYRILFDTVDAPPRYFKSWSQDGVPVLTPYHHDAHVYEDFHMCQRNARWAYKLGAFYKVFPLTLTKFHIKQS